MKDHHVLEEQADHWVADNQAYLTAALAEVKAALSRHVDRGTSAGGKDAAFGSEEVALEIVSNLVSSSAPLPGEPAAIETLCAATHCGKPARSLADSTNPLVRVVDEVRFRTVD